MIREQSKSFWILIESNLYGRQRRTLELIVWTDHLSFRLWRWRGGVCEKVKLLMIIKTHTYGSLCLVINTLYIVVSVYLLCICYKNCTLEKTFSLLKTNDDWYGVKHLRKGLGILGSVKIIRKLEKLLSNRGEYPNRRIYIHRPKR